MRGERRSENEQRIEYKVLKNVHYVFTFFLLHVIKTLFLCLLLIRVLSSFYLLLLIINFNLMLCQMRDSSKPGFFLLFFLLLVLLLHLVLVLIFSAIDTINRLVWFGWLVAYF